MKLRNKKTGEIREIKNIIVDGMFTVNSIAELNEEWEDYEEKGWYITEDGEARENRSVGIVEEESRYIEIGNLFGTREEAEKAVEKLKAWKRLKNFGFKFIGKDYRGDKNFGSAFFQVGEDKNIRDFYQDNQDFYDDLDLLFCPEENS